MEKDRSFRISSGKCIRLVGNTYQKLCCRSITKIKNGCSQLDDYDDDYEDFFILPTLSPKTDKIDFETAQRFKPSVETALSRLTDAQKYVIHLAYYEGYNLEEIADKLNIPVETVRNKILTAMQNLKDQLST